MGKTNPTKYDVLLSIELLVSVPRSNVACVI
jgi:hypothetical protein